MDPIEAGNSSKVPCTPKANHSRPLFTIKLALEEQLEAARASPVFSEIHVEFH